MYISYANKSEYGISERHLYLFKQYHIYIFWKHLVNLLPYDSEYAENSGFFQLERN